MSYGDYDDAWGEAARDQYMAELYEKHYEEALEQFTSERLQSYFLKTPDLAAVAIRMLERARQLQSSSQAAALVFGATAIELGLKLALLKPVVYGLVHTESVAGLITELIVAHRSMDRFRTLLFQLLLDHAGVDLRTYKRTGETTPLWEEIKGILVRRNGLLHRGEETDEPSASRAIAVAGALLEEIFPAVVLRLRLHLHEGTRVCGDYRCDRPGAP